MEPKDLPPISTAEAFNEASEEHGWNYKIRTISEGRFRWEVVNSDGLSRGAAMKERDAVVWANFLQQSETK